MRLISPGSSFVAILTTAKIIVAGPSAGNRIRGTPSFAASGVSFFAADPELASATQAIFWSPEVFPSVLALEPDRSSSSISPVRVDLEHLAPDAFRRADDGWYALLAIGAEKYRLFFPQQPAIAGPYLVVLPFDADFAQRLRAAESFWRACSGRPAIAPVPALPHERRRRILLMLRAFDGRAAGASYRGIAEGLFGHAKLKGKPWKTHDLRSKVIRLVRGGMALVKRGYRALLRLVRRRK